MWIDQYLTDEQDPKTAEKVLNKLRDMLTSDEAIVYLAIQKKPAVTLMPDSIVVTSKRLVFCQPGNLGLTTNFITFTWEDIKEVSFKEEFFGAKFLAIPQKGENIAVDYIPKIQARKLYQFCNEQLEKKKVQPDRKEEHQPAIHQVDLPVAETVLSEPVSSAEDELTQKLKKLKVLFEKQLITQEEYEQKKADILSQL
ncbi:MAG TPA: PH domain-containing protein [Sphingobacteriaceae bacterium]